ncbi:MAG TPA: SDR family oxidoreductase [Smithellaceae bacterium]|nr:SDR family oxidoreductase [Smithellaceae bacterium]
MNAKKRVLVLGATGMLGHMVRRVLAESAVIDVEGTHVCEKGDPFYCDVTAGLDDLEAICDRTPRYDYFINCIGILPAGISGSDPATIRKAIKINSLFPHELSTLAKEREARVIHISTDGVFSGQAEIYYEDAAHDCQDLYGITKSLGEVIDGHFLNLRCSIIGPSPYLGKGLMEWFLRQPGHSTVSGYTNHIWHGVSTYQFAHLCLKIIRDDHFENLRREAAVFHFAPNEPIAKYDLLCLFQSIFKSNVNIQPVASDDKTYRRILRTRYQALQQIYPYGISAVDMVSELAAYMKDNRGQYHEGNIG